MREKKFSNASHCSCKLLVAEDVVRKKALLDPAEEVLLHSAEEMLLDPTEEVLLHSAEEALLDPATEAVTLECGVTEEKLRPVLADCEKLTKVAAEEVTLASPLLEKEVGRAVEAEERESQAVQEEPIQESQQKWLIVES
ncbi:unnamed protein product [Thelazia callipaeda]|uniref:Perilipin-3-like n=1 Tax=Thelazia callipaeda TaxID=103827 RepID=A0A0N5DAX9_THECL|nr:unnamed protein product [Thelazia callipaeda]